MNSISDHTIFNSIDPSFLEPKQKKAMPFPLENMDQEIANLYQSFANLLGRFQAAERNPVNLSPARKRKLKSIKYKIKTCMQMMQEISNSCSELWY